MSEISELQIPAQKMLDDLGIKYIHLQKTRNNKFDINKRIKGAPDLVIFFFKNVVCVEFKTGKNELTEKQREWKNYLIDKEYVYFEIREIEHFKEIVKGFYAGRNI